MTKTNLVLFAVVGMAVAGPCKPGSLTARTTEVSASYSASVPSIATLTSSTTGIVSASTTDTTNQEEATMILSTLINSETTIDSNFFTTETVTFEPTGSSLTEVFADTTLTTLVASLSVSETSSEATATTTSATNEPYECVGSIRIQEGHYIGIRGGYQGKMTFTECAQLCEDSSCYAFSHNSDNSCWNAAAAGDVAIESESPGWQGGIKGTCHRAK